MSAFTIKLGEQLGLVKSGWFIVASLIGIGIAWANIPKQTDLAPIHDQIATHDRRLDLLEAHIESQHEETQVLRQGQLDLNRQVIEIARSVGARVLTTR